MEICLKGPLEEWMVNHKRPVIFQIIFLICGVFTFLFLVKLRKSFVSFSLMSYILISEIL